jgi:hypothetical protein
MKLPRALGCILWRGHRTRSSGLSSRRLLHNTHITTSGKRDENGALPAHETRADRERTVKRNPHPDFGTVEASRPDWRGEKLIFTKTKEPRWHYGEGPNDGGACLQANHVEIDPYEQGRPAVFNYKLLISAIIPRFIGFISTRSRDGKSIHDEVMCRG